MSYALVFVAEIGDKSQLMCMVLAARYRAAPVACGAVMSFVLLNGLAVLLGAGIAQLIAPQYISVIVALLFFAFGVHALLIGTQQEEVYQATNLSAKRLFLTTFMLITVAEFGDKTQLAVVALGSSDLPLSIFIGSTLALITTTLLGVWAGQQLLKKIPMPLVARLSGLFFMLLGVVATIKAISLFNA